MNVRIVSSTSTICFRAATGRVPPIRRRRVSPSTVRAMSLRMSLSSSDTRPITAGASSSGNSNAKDPAMTGRVAKRIIELDADLLLVQEAEDQTALEHFHGDGCLGGWL
jgi:hypothetical protein